MYLACAFGRAHQQTTAPKQNVNIFQLLHVLLLYGHVSVEVMR